MYRLKLTRNNGEEILGPFVYDITEDQTKKKVKEMDWVCFKDKKRVSNLSFFEVTNPPKGTIFDPDSAIWDRDEDAFEFIKHLEQQWKEMKGE